MSKYLNFVLIAVMALGMSFSVACKKAEQPAPAAEPAAAEQPAPAAEEAAPEATEEAAPEATNEATTEAKEGTAEETPAGGEQTEAPAQTPAE